MKKFNLSVLSLLLLCGIIAAHPNQDPAASENLVIQVSPQTIILGRDANEGNVWVTIHAEIGFSSAYDVSVEIEGVDHTVIEAEVTFADSRGDLVAKFRYDDLAELLGPGDAVLRLHAVIGETTYTGSDEIRVFMKK